MQQKLRQTLDAIESQGKEIKFTWEGGNDNGSFYMYIDDEQIEESDEYPWVKEVMDIIDQELDYGSFAGDFNTNGELIYADGHFTGTDFNSTTEGDLVELSEDEQIRIEVPEYLWFDQLVINSEGYLENDLNVTVDFRITNGPIVDHHVEKEDDIRNFLTDSIFNLLNAISDVDITYVYNDWSFDFNKGVVEDDKRVFFIDEIQYSYELEESRDIDVEITD
jgi:hypothetical protein